MHKNFIFFFVLFMVFITSCNQHREVDFTKIRKEIWHSGMVEGKQMLIKIQQSTQTKCEGIAFVNQNKAWQVLGSITMNEEGFEYRCGEDRKIKKGNWIISNNAFVLENETEGEITFAAIEEVLQGSMEGRYQQEVFKKYHREEVTYGHAPGFYQSKPVPDMNSDSYPHILSEVLEGISDNILAEDIALTMDIYEPEGDKLQKRPLLVLIHGGAFIVGDKRDDFQIRLAERYTKRGYVVASINYRMGYLFLPGAYSNLERCIHRAVQDSRAALRWMIHHQTKYRIDPTAIILAGNSAGGFIALKTAFMTDDETYESAEGNLFMLQEDLGCLDCAVNQYKDKFSIRGVINLWGAITDDRMIDTEESMPLLLIHGDSDRIVPYGFNYPFRNIDEDITSFFMEKVNGSRVIRDRAKRLGFPVKLVTFPGAPHEPQVDGKNQPTALMDSIFKHMDDFLYSLLLPETPDISGNKKPKCTAATTEYSIAGKSKNTKVYWLVEGGCVVEKPTPNRARIVWFSNADKHSLQAVIVGPNGKSVRSQPINIANCN